MRRRQTAGDLHSVINRFANRQRPALQRLPKRGAFEQLGNQIADAIVRPQLKDHQDIGMIQRGCGARFLFEAPQAVGIGREKRGQDFDGDIASKLRIAGAVHFAHPTRTNGSGDFIGAEPRAGC